MCKLSKLHLRHLQCELEKWVGNSQSRQSSAGATYFCPCPTERVRESRDRAWTVSNSHSQTEPRPSQVYALRLCHTLAVSMVTTYFPGVSNVRHWEEWILFISSPSRISKYSSWSFLLGAVRKKSGVRLLKSAPSSANEQSVKSISIFLNRPNNNNTRREKPRRKINNSPLKTFKAVCRLLLHHTSKLTFYNYD